MILITLEFLASVAFVGIYAAYMKSGGGSGGLITTVGGFVDELFFNEGEPLLVYEA